MRLKYNSEKHFSPQEIIDLMGENNQKGSSKIAVELAFKLGLPRLYMRPYVGIREIENYDLNFLSKVITFNF